jgi:pyruvate dehydrogenase E2 component (dihydrolipoamide acetyltransferase)
MATEVIIPALGVVVEKVKILKWLKTEGDRVKEGDPLLEIESEKVTMEIPSPATGVLGCILYNAGTEVPITEVVAVIVAEGESVPGFYLKQAKEALPSGAPVAMSSFLSAGKDAKPAKAAPAARKIAEEKGIDLSLITPTGPHGTIMKKDVEAYLASVIPAKESQRVSSLARKVAEQVQVPLHSVQGTGTRGRIMKADVMRVVERSEGVRENPLGRVIPMNKMRQVISRRMSESAFTAPHIYFFTDVHMEKLLDLREGILKDFEGEFNVRLSVNDFLIKAVALAIRKYPLLNAMVKGEQIHVHPQINVGLAVALDEGLIVPAIPKADELGLGKIAQTRADLVDRARKGKLKIDEIERGTFTISSLASFDITFFTAILNPPQSGILTVGKIQDQLYLEGDGVKLKKMTSFGLSVDHRIIDGTVAAGFLQAIKKMIENPSFHFLGL